MSIREKSVIFNDITFGKDSKDHLIGGVGRQIKKIITIDVYAKSVAGLNNATDDIDERFFLKISDSENGGFSTLSRIEGDFIDDGFVKGDTITLEDSPTSQVLTIKSISSNLVVFVESASNFSDTNSETMTMTVDPTQYTAIEVKSAMNVNSDSTIISLVDQTTPTFSGNIDSILIPKNFQSGYATPRTGISQTASYSGNDIIVSLYQHICPFFEDYNQLDGDKPSFFDGNECVNWYTNIKLLKNINNPNESREISINSSLASTGYLNENYNGGLNPYEVINLTVKSYPGNKDLKGIQTDKSTEIKFRIKSTSALIWSTATYQVCFCCVLEGEDHKNKLTPYTDNVYFENCVVDSGSPEKQGTRFLADGEGFQSVKFDYVDSANVDCTIIFSPGANLRNTILNEEKKKFLLWVNTEIDNETDIYLTKETPLEILKGDLLIEPNLDAQLRLNPWKFYEHDELIDQESKTAYRGYLTDDVFATQDIGLNDLKAEITEITIGLYVKAYDRANFGFTLEEFNFKTEGQNFDEIAANINRGYLLESTDRHNRIELKRITANDGAYKCLRISYAFRFRWEYWVKKPEVSSGFIDVGLPNEGKNEKWDRFDVDGQLLYDLGTIYCRSKIKTKSKEVEGLVNEEIIETVLRVGDFEEPMDNEVTWTAPTQVTKKTDLTEISPKIQGNDTTILEYDFVSSPPHGGANLYYGAIKAENYEGGVFSIHQISTEKTPIAGLLKPNTGETKATITEINPTTLRVSCAVDPSFITKNKISFYPRLGRKAKKPTWSFHTTSNNIFMDFDVPVDIEMGDDTILTGTNFNHAYTRSGKKLVTGSGNFTTASVFISELEDWADFTRIPILEDLDLHDNFALKQVFIGASEVKNLNLNNCNLSELDLTKADYNLGAGTCVISVMNNPNMTFVEFKTGALGVIDELYLSGNDLEYIDLKPILKAGITIDLSNNAMIREEVDLILQDIADEGTVLVDINISGNNAAPGVQGLAAKTIIEGNSGTVTVTV